MKIDSLRRRLKGLEDLQAVGIPTHDELGNRRYIAGSGLSMNVRLMRFIQDAAKAGKSPKWADLEPDLLKDLELWSRAEVTEESSGLANWNRRLAAHMLGCINEV